MKFYLYPKDEQEFDDMINIAKQENVFRKVNTKRENIPFGYQETYSVIIDCDYNKLEFIKYLINKKQEQCLKLETCLKETERIITKKLNEVTINSDKESFATVTTIDSAITFFNNVETHKDETFDFMKNLSKKLNKELKKYWKKGWIDKGDF